MSINNVLETVTTEVFANVNIAIVIGLMAVGFIIKHFKFLEKINNELIPPILLILSMIFTFIDNGISVSSTLVALVSAAVAIGLHEQGKNIFTITIVPTITDILNKNKSE